MTKGSRIALLVVTTVVFTSIPIGLKFSSETRKMRGDVDFILEWEEASSGSVALQRLLSDPEENKGQLREIMTQIRSEVKAEEIRQALAKLEQRKEVHHLPKKPSIRY